MNRKKKVIQGLAVAFQLTSLIIAIMCGPKFHGRFTKTSGSRLAPYRALLRAPSIQTKHELQLSLSDANNLYLINIQSNFATVNLLPGKGQPGEN